MSADGRIRSPFATGFPPGPAIVRQIKDALSAFHPMTAEELARRIGHTTPRQIQEVENVLLYLRGRSEVRQADDGGWLS
ncbi:hypothetical protein [Streptomyces sp. GbtcB6]|uniref:hypothetical protein n=1 Tax=Streptomyces sp. GbtcB6 TaxID=2824751 RepID=UPI001C304CE5|nr:hypothetical protein [Streptomyces sp. GbtcB6]